MLNRKHNTRAFKGTAIVTMATIAATLFTGMVISPAQAQDKKSLEQLLQEVRAAKSQEAQRNRERESRFIEKVQERESLLSAAKKEQSQARSRRDSLQKQFSSNEDRLAELSTQLTDRAGDFGEVFGVVRQVAGDARSTIKSSLVSAELKDRGEFLDQMAESKALPSIDDIEKLWTTMLGEMVETGAVSRFNSEITLPDGSAKQAEVIRVGTFNASTGEDFLQYTPSTGQLSMLPRQPASRWQSLAQNLASAQPGSGTVETVVDPSRGAILGLLIQKPNLLERIQQGKIVGYVVLAVGLLGLLIALERLFALVRTESGMRSQRKNLDSPKSSNPLGRVLNAYHNNRDADVETLQLKLDEAILKDVPSLERGLGTIKILAAVAPLLGLLGTVVGMIATFQAITLFGTGDPKLMAGGISQALVTTVLGLVVAVPLILLHSMLAGRSRRLIQTLEQQSSGVVAAHAEAARA